MQRPSSRNVQDRFRQQPTCYEQSSAVTKPHTRQPTALASNSGRFSQATFFASSSQILSNAFNRAMLKAICRHQKLKAPNQTQTLVQFCSMHLPCRLDKNSSCSLRSKQVPLGVLGFNICFVSGFRCLQRFALPQQTLHDCQFM